jgi:hypothetical protein
MVRDKKFKQPNQILVNESNGDVIAGLTRLLAAEIVIPPKLAYEKRG